MATSLLAVGTTAATSTDLVVAAGTPVTVGLKVTSGSLDSAASVLIKLKDELGNYNTVGRLDAYNRATVINGPGTYQFVRPAGPSCGVYSA